MEFSRLGNFFVVALMALVFIMGVFFAVQVPISKVLSQTASQNSQAKPVYLPPRAQKLANPPQIIKGLYVTGYSAGSKSYLNYLSKIFKTTQINAVVVDIKGSNGWVTYKSGAEQVKKFSLSNGSIKDIDAFVNFFHDNGIYVIGRISVFEDPKYAKAKPNLAVYNRNKTLKLSEPVLWKDNNGLEWLDPASKDVWAYNVSLARDALFHGFDEINFDYIRFPSDGDTSAIGYPVYDGKSLKTSVIKDFFRYLRDQLAGEKISIDLFGLVTIKTDDLGIGQVLEDSFENFDYICPMVYPSHYASGFRGYKNPAEYPYDVIKYSMDTALSRLFDKNVKLRPWLQDFDMGAKYTAEMVKQEIKAVQDSLGENFAGFLIWNPSNVYTTEAILKE